MRSRSAVPVSLSALVLGWLVVVAPPAQAATVVAFPALSNALDASCVPGDTTTLGGSISAATDGLLQLDAGPERS